jgi:hypothetical protein
MQNRHKIFFGLSIVILIIFVLTINTTIESFEDKYKSQEIVIARYNEDLEWIKEEPFNRHPIIVYNKSDNYDFSKTNITQIINLPNIGRETHSYLYHIVKNYDNLKDVTIFLPGSAELPNKFERSKNVVKTVEETNNTVFSCSNEDNFVENNYNFEIENNLSSHANNKKINDDATIKLSENRPFGKWYNSVFTNEEKNTCISWNSILAVSRKNILQKPKSYYEKLMKEVDEHQNPEAGHYLERSWYAVFYPYTNAKFI